MGEAKVLVAVGVGARDELLAEAAMGLQEEVADVRVLLH
jgi:hypothetical protein